MFSFSNSITAFFNSANLAGSLVSLYSLTNLSTFSLAWVAFWFSSFKNSDEFFKELNSNGDLSALDSTFSFLFNIPSNFSVNSGWPSITSIFLKPSNLSSNSKNSLPWNFPLTFIVNIPSLSLKDTIVALSNSKPCSLKAFNASSFFEEAKDLSNLES